MEPAIQPHAEGHVPDPFQNQFGRASKPALPVLVAGLVTGILALAGAWFLYEATEFNLMGWYFWFVLPAGAIITGLVAGSGYGIASWKTGTKISKGLLWAVVGLQVVCYFGMQVMEYRQVVALFEIEDLSFLAYFDEATRSWAFITDGETGAAMGAWGYAFRLLEIGGFVFGGLVAPLVMRAAPFCEACQVFMKRKQVGLVPAGVEPRKVGKKDVAGQEAFAAEAEAAWNGGIDVLEGLCDAAMAGDADRFHALMSPYAGDQKAIDKLTARIRVMAEVCPQCHQGAVVSESLVGQGENLQTTAMTRTPIGPQLARTLR